MTAQSSQSNRSCRAFFRALLLPEIPTAADREAQLEQVKWQAYSLLEKFRKRYPFTFASARRDVRGERHRQAQEKLMTLFMLGAMAALTELEPARRVQMGQLANHLSQHIGKGGENFCPHEFTTAEKTLAREIGPDHFDAMLERAEAFSRSVSSKLGPVNSSEQVLFWSLRYLGQLLRAAKWESGHPED